MAEIGPCSAKNSFSSLKRCSRSSIGPHSPVMRRGTDMGRVLIIKLLLKLIMFSLDPLDKLVRLLFEKPCSLIDDLIGHPMVLIKNPNAQASRVVGPSPGKYFLVTEACGQYMISCSPSAKTSSAVCHPYHAHKSAIGSSGARCQPAHREYIVVKKEALQVRAASPTTANSGSLSSLSRS